MIDPADYIAWLERRNRYLDDLVAILDTNLGTGDIQLTGHAKHQLSVLVNQLAQHDERKPNV